MGETIYSLKTIPEFRQLVLPPTPDERKAMEEEILNPDQNHIIRVWYNTILVDYAYYEYCEMLQLPFETRSIPYMSKEEAIAWICENQLNRPELPTAMWRYLVGKRAATEIKIGAHQYSSTRKRTTRRAGAVVSRSKYDNSQTGSRERIGKQYGIAVTTVWKYERYANAIDKIREIEPGFIEEHLAGKYRVSIDRAEAMAKLTSQKLREECERIILEEQQQIPVSWKKRLQAEPVKNNTEVQQTISIKDMPKYDPDAEISSLALTIPSWISSIIRVYNTAEIATTTHAARVQLENALIQLNAAASIMLGKVKEGEQLGLR